MASMSCSNHLLSGALLLALTTIASGSSGGPQDPELTPRPNLLLVIADDCTVWDTSVYGGQARTPNLEKLAEEGMTFTRCFQAAPMCSPTRHALYTGLYPVRSGAYPNHTYVRDGVESVAKWLVDGGYRAHLSGKTHIQPREAFPFEYSRERSNKSTNPDFEVVDGFLAECAASETPFGLFLCSNEPHTPWNKGDPEAYAPEELELPPIYADTPETRAGFSRYLAEITYFDEQVGRALELIEKHDLAGNTVVVVLTEQGNSLPFAKWTCYEAGVASGLIVRWPGRVEPGSKSDALVEYVDIVPTFLDAAGIERPGDLDGRSFRAVLEGERRAHKSRVFSLQTSRGINNGPEHYGIRSVRDEQFRYVLNLTPEVVFQNAATTSPIWSSWVEAAESGNPMARQAVSRYLCRPAEELYDVTVDRWNQDNLADDFRYEEIKAKLRGALDEWMEQQGDLGQETELAADGRLWKKRRKKGENE